MPRGIKVIILCNLFFASMFPMFFYVLKEMNTIFPLAALISTLITSGLIMISVVIIFRLIGLLAFARVLLYAIMLTLGLNTMLLLKWVLTPFGIFSILVNIFIVIYLIGARGYLASSTSIDYFLRRN